MCCPTPCLQLGAARSALERQLSLSQAEVRSLGSQLKDASAQLAALQEDHEALQGVAGRLRDERGRLMSVSVCAASVH